ncbi:MULTISPECIES: HD-GYP domain-containing protein [Gracilibacillus]|uniref:HD-GYP domain-containing protein n=1 Tax=Gracilibacillus TaxID=74385 RepID=UPI00082665FF|nr:MULTISPECIES: HD-GYP domain-containing protein [Gracilibacillus]
MQNSHSFANLLNEEKRATTWFLWLFYTTYFCYELLYYYLLPIVAWNFASDVQKNLVDVLMYVFLLALLPVAIYKIRQNKPASIKYLYFIVFIVLSMLYELYFYATYETPYTHGSIIEIIFILFSPIFVSKRFFYVVFLGVMGKYIIVGIALQDLVFILPLFVVFVFSCVAFIVLSRFISYVAAFRESYDQQIENIAKGIIATLELKDRYTKGHSDRVANYSLILLKSFPLSQQGNLRLFYYACLLHDIGKISIPDAILTKDSQLTEAEYQVIKTHPVVGAEALANVEGIKEYIDVIRHHHERWDGHGYPDGLRRREITLFARVVAIADAFDAMTSSRSYRAAVSPEEAYERIMKASGSQFDPQVVEHFKEVYPLWIDYHNESKNKKREV